MFSGRYTFDDIKLLYQYLDKECPGAFVQMKIEQNGTLEITTRNKFDEEIKIEIYDEAIKMFPKIIKEDRLSNVLRDKK